MQIEFYQFESLKVQIIINFKIQTIIIIIARRYQIKQMTKYMFDLVFKRLILGL